MELPRDFSNGIIPVGKIKKISIIDASLDTNTDSPVERACVVQCIAETDCRIAIGLLAEANETNSLPIIEGLSREYYVEKGDSVSVWGGKCTLVYMW